MQNRMKNRIINLPKKEVSINLKLSGFTAKNNRIDIINIPFTYKHNITIVRYINVIFSPELIIINNHHRWPTYCRYQLSTLCQ